MSGERAPAKGSAQAKRPRWESGLVIVDKAGGMTSHDVVARVRRLAGTRRVGHAGTLDPMATGVLVIGVEKATRLLGYLMLTEKEYAATIRLGQSTTTDDAEGELAGGATAAAITRVAVDAEIARLTGAIMQVPPGVSAIKVNGERAYKLTRAGAAPELAARPVTVYSFTVTSVRPAGDFLDIDAVIRCSSGTYVRALARDLGTALGVGGHLTALRRTAVGPYHLDQARTLEELENKDPSEERAVPSPHPRSAIAALQAGTATTTGAATAAPTTATATTAANTTATATAANTTATATTTAAVTASAPVTVPGSWVTPLAHAAAAAFPRLDLSAGDARRLAQGARLPLPALPEPSLDPKAPIAAFAPDGTLVALVSAESGSLRSLAVFIDAQQTLAGE
jgi:tRNA pseudouridine55 synthase